MTTTAQHSRQLAHDSRQLYLPDLLRLSSVGLRTRKLRAALSALGIALCITSCVIGWRALVPKAAARKTTWRRTA